MVPPCSLRIPRVRRYSGYRSLHSRFVYRTLTVFGRPSHVVQLRYCVLISVRTPSVFLQRVWPLPLSLATTHGISFDFSSSAYLDVSVRQVPSVYLWIQYTVCNSSLQGFPHSEIHGSMLISSSPWLIAGCRVLHRLSVPRHSPYALFRLNSSACFRSLKLIQVRFFA